MEDKIKKKKKLTLSISSKKAHNVPNYAQARGKTSVIIEKKISRRWGEKKFQSQDSNIEQSSFYLSSGFIRTDIRNNLNGKGASSLMNGLFLGNDSQFIDNNIVINHNTEETDSRVLYKGILDGNSQAVFNALVDVPFKSKNINSDQKNHNILLSKKARINSNPKLKISCDEVKCSHGSTIGNLNPDELFYLRSRGINLKKSKKILLDSFMNEIIQNAPFQDITNYINTRIDRLV